MIRHNDRRGFTLAELLIVVAIIGVLASIAIPIFSKQLEKSREATDLANVRSAYAAVVTAEISGGDSGVKQESAGAYYIDVKLRQKQSDWQTTLPITLGGVSSSDTEHWRGTPRADGCCKVKVVSGEVFLFWNGNALATVAGDDGYSKGYFWTQDPNNRSSISKVYTPAKNCVAPVTLNKGDSFSVSKDCFIGDTDSYTQGIFAFYLVEKESTTGSSYNAIMDSGWMRENYFTNGFTAVKDYVKNPSDYYTAEVKGDRLVFTITNEEGLSLLVNNNTYSNSAKMLNDVIIDRAD